MWLTARIRLVAANGLASTDVHALFQTRFRRMFRLHIKPITFNINTPLTVADVRKMVAGCISKFKRQRIPRPQL